MSISQDASSYNGMVQPAIFEELQAKIDEETQVRDELKGILNTLEKQVESLVKDAQASILKQCETISELSKVASRYPYYKYYMLWTRDIQNVVFAILFCGWLGDFRSGSDTRKSGTLYTIDEVGSLLGVPVNLKDRDAFHLSVEDYLHGLISLIDELARLAVNSVTLGDYERAPQISNFIKGVHAGFQILNLKNDALRKRSDSIKYSVKKVEDVVYDLSLRNLLPKKSDEEGVEMEVQS
ncbi:hypothetical protein MMC25_005426 [Agyrium rufum]|nr:hypothetical protein [Agyrium rufum]